MNQLAGFELVKQFTASACNLARKHPGWSWTAVHRHTIRANRYGVDIHTDNALNSCY
jgi:hypothetical protein